jgi:hypothetical protein
MTKSDTTTKGGRRGKGEGSREGMERRARIIMGDADRYDYDTRYEVWLAMMTGGDSELTRTVRVAEEQGYIEKDSRHAEQTAVARALLKLMYNRGCADWLTQGIHDLLMIAGREFGFEPWRREERAAAEVEGGWSVSAIAGAFVRYDNRTLEIERKRDLPSLIAAVLTHDDTPAALHNAMRDALNSLPGVDRAQKTASYLSELLRLGVEAEEGGAL